METELKWQRLDSEGDEGVILSNVHFLNMSLRWLMKRPLQTWSPRRPCGRCFENVPSCLSSQGRSPISSGSFAHLVHAAPPLGGSEVLRRVSLGSQGPGTVNICPTKGSMTSHATIKV